MKRFEVGINSTFHMSEMLYEVGERLLREYGRLQRPRYDALSNSDDPVIEHFLCCNDEMALDFVELCFQTKGHCAGQDGVDAINEVLRDAGVGYELTPFVRIDQDEFDKTNPSAVIAFLCQTNVEYEYPRIIRKDQQSTHEKTVRPCLELLSDPKFRTANSEMLKAHEHYRKGNYADALTACASSFESVLKTICDEKNWTYNSDRDTCATLIRICKDHGLFPSFYAPIFEATGTVRNKLGDAHGRGPVPKYVVGKGHVDHLIQMTSAHILLLVEQAQL